MSPKILAILLLVTSVGVISAQEDLCFEQINVDNGLSQSDVRCVLLDSRGYIWISTRSGGLNVFNGFSFVYFKEGSGKKDISRNEIFGLLEDENGDIWLSLSEGLNRINVADGTVDRFLHKRREGQDFINDFTTTLALDKAGRIWLNSVSGVASFDIRKENYNYYSKEQFVRTPYQTTVTKDGNIWVVTSGNTLYKYDSERDSFLVVDSVSLETNSTVAMCERTPNTLVLVSKSLGVVEYNTHTNESRVISNKLSEYVKQQDLEIDSVSFCSRGWLWIGSRWYGGLIRYKPQDGSITHLKKAGNPDAGLLSGHVDCLTLDDAGTLWVGTRAGGITKISKAKFDRIVPTPMTKFGRDSATVRSIFLDSQNVLWVGTDKGISLIDRENQTIELITTIYPDSQEIHLKSVYIIREISPGQMLIGGVGMGLVLLDTKTLRGKYLYQTPQARYMEGDNLGGYWLSQGRGSIIHFEIKKSKFVQNEVPQKLIDELGVRYVRCITVSRDGVVWFGTNSGMFSFNHESHEIVNYESGSNDVGSLRGENIYAILESKDGEIWIGTAGRGINILDPEARKFSYLSTEEGLPDDIIYQLAQDEAGLIWAATNNGLASINEEGVIKSYSVKDGLQSREFNVGACFQSEAGELFFGGINGLNYFKAGQVKESSYIPQVRISAISINKGKFYSLDGKYPNDILDIDYEDRDLKFEFLASDYSVLKEPKFKYRLTGYDRDWRSSGSNIAVYTNVPPGDHEIQVVGTNADGVWNKQISKVKFSVRYPFWQTWWFYTLVLCSLALLIYGLILWRVHRIKSQRDKLEKEVQAQTKVLSQRQEDLEYINQELKTFSYTVSHDIRTPIYRIGNYCEFLLEDYSDKLEEEGLSFLKKIHGDVNKANLLVNSLLQLAKVDKAELDLQKVNLSKVAENIVKDLVSPDQNPKVSFEFDETIEVKADQGLITILLENLLNNAVKFTKDKEKPVVSISSELLDGQQVITLKDNGVGFDSEKAKDIFIPFKRLHSDKRFKGTGIGLSTVKRIIKRHGGWIVAKSQPDQGASFSFTLSEA